MIAIPSNKKRLFAMVCEIVKHTMKFSRFTGDLEEAMQTLCALLNGTGGMLLFGSMFADGVEGLQPADQIEREIAQAAERFKPPARVRFGRIRVGKDAELLVAGVTRSRYVGPYTYAGCPYERAGRRTRKMKAGKFIEDTIYNLLMSLDS
jgi:ATP-dependent DNA helicase RecG